MDSDIEVLYINLKKRNSFHLYEVFVHYTADDLLKAGIGFITLTKIREILEAQGLKLKND